MHYIHRIFLMFSIAVAVVASAQEMQHQQIKAENGFIISWEGVSTDPQVRQVEISDQMGHIVVTLKVLRAVPEASRVSIYDISARGNMIAVSAIYENKQGNRQVNPVASLLLFDFRGELLSAHALDPSRAISLLEIDSQSNVWTLTDGAGTTVDPSTVPMIVEYTATGRVVREMLTRNMFPLHSQQTQGNSVMGWPAMGCDSGVLWFWLPGSTDFVTIATADGKVTMTKTHLPTRTGRDIIPLGISRDRTGDLVVQVREDDAQRRPDVQYEVEYYKWSPATGLWTSFRPGGCEGGRLIGMSDAGQAYLEYQSDRLPKTICTFAAE